MLFSWKKKKDVPDLAWLHTDMHSHLLPGIDDGSQDLATSMKLIRGLVELGYKKLVTTPHILWEMYPNDPQIINTKTEEVRQELGVQGIDVEFHSAAEYFIDDHFASQLEVRAPLLTLKDNLVLVEYSMITAPMELQEVLFELQLQNYQPVIAHPERYIYLSRKKEFFDELRAAGCLFQLNLLSLGGHYGASVQELAGYLLKKEYYDYAGTDLHHARHLDALRRIPVQQMNRLKDSGRIQNHLL
jgi:protein-tyrosine phosphatase